MTACRCFCRHHDELNLGLLSNGEHDEAFAAFAAFAPEPEHRLFGGWLPGPFS